ncbi:MAG: iron-sulfur cluster assembly scaffold protein [Pseudomonadota bacterium]
MGWNYSDKTKQLFMDAVHGKPGTHLGEIEDPDGVGEHGSISCGDAMRFTFRVKRDPVDPRKDVITDAKYLTFGCTSAIASSEALCCLIEEGTFTPIQALQVKNEDIVNYLEGLPTQKIHCSVMGAEALEAAVYNWAQKRGVPVRELGIEPRLQPEDEGRIVCKCFNITEPYLERKIKELNLRTIPEVTSAIKAGGACMTCHHAPGGIQDTLDGIWGRTEGDAEPGLLTAREPARRADDEPLSPYQFAKKVERVVEESVRPMLQKDGGDVEIVDIKDRLVYCQLAGACHGCAGATMTLKLMIEKTLKEKVDDRIRVIQL